MVPSFITLVGLCLLFLVTGCASPEVSPRKIACNSEDQAKQECSEPARKHSVTSRERP